MGIVLRGNDSNVRQGSRIDGRGWREFCSLVRRIATANPSLRPKLMTGCVVLASLIPILWESGVGSDVMKTTAAPIVGGMITSTIHVLILVPVFFALMNERALRRGTLHLQGNDPAKDWELDSPIFGLSAASNLVSI
ncbi:MAG: efflux RND transporter permease subunit [Candidatus Acidiferrum sp.]